MSAPVISPVAQRLYTQLEKLAWDDPNRQYALAHLCEAMVGNLQEVEDYARDYEVTVSKDIVIPLASSRPWIPTDITGCERWFDANQISGVAADGASVGSWTDLSGNAGHLTEATNQPVLKTNIVNGLPVVRFDGTNDKLIGSIAADATRTLFIVAKLITVTGSKPLLTLGSDFAEIVSDSGGGGTWVWRTNQAAGTVTFGSSSAFAVMAVRVNSASSADLYYNGGGATNFDPADDVTTGTFLELARFGGGFTNCDIAEVITYNSALSNADLDTVRNYLGAKYSLGFGSTPPDVSLGPTTTKTYTYKQTKPGWAKLFDIDKIPANAVPWLAQFVGVAEPKYAGEDEAAYAARLKPLILAPTGFKRGNPQTIIDSVKDTLTGTKTVYLTERQGSAYTMAVATWAAETPNPTLTASRARSQKPGGLIMNVSTITGGNYQTLRDVHTDYLDVRTQFATFTALRDDPSLT